MKTPIEITRLRGGALAIHSAGRRIAVICADAASGQDAASAMKHAKIIQAALQRSRKL